jgi:hypothetical protein
MNKEIQIYLDMSDEKLENMRKLYAISCSLAILAILIVAGLFLYFIYVQQTTTAILLLFGFAIVLTGSIFSRQTLRYIEVVQEFKNIKSNEISSTDG